MKYTRHQFNVMPDFVRVRKIFRSILLGNQFLGKNGCVGQAPIADPTSRDPSMIIRQFASAIIRHFHTVDSGQYDHFAVSTWCRTM